MDDLGNSNIRYFVTFVLVTIEESVNVAKASEDVQLVDRDQFERSHVENEGDDGAQIVACVHHVRMVEGERDKRVDEYPAMKVPVTDMRHFIFFGMDRYILVERGGMDAQNFVKPVENCPIISIKKAPSGLHRVLRVAFGFHGACLLGCEVFPLFFCKRLSPWGRGSETPALICLPRTYPKTRA